MTCHIGRAIDEIFLLKVVQQPIVDGMRGFVAQEYLGILSHGKGTSVLVIERVWRGTIDIL